MYYRIDYKVRVDTRRSIQSAAVDCAQRINKLVRWEAYLPADALADEQNDTPGSRVRCDAEMQSVWLDGKKIGEGIQPVPFRIFHAIAEAGGTVVGSATLRSLPGLRQGSTKIKRHLDKLPVAVRKLVKSKAAGGGGYWLHLPPPKSRP
jgi:hypothetical protein